MILKFFYDKLINMNFVFEAIEREVRSGIIWVRGSVKLDSGREVKFIAGVSTNYLDDNFKISRDAAKTAWLQLVENDLKTEILNSNKEKHIKAYANSREAKGKTFKFLSTVTF